MEAVTFKCMQFLQQKNVLQMPKNDIFPFIITISQLEYIKYLLGAQYCRGHRKKNQEDLTESTPPEKSIAPALKELNNQSEKCM